MFVMFFCGRNEPSSNMITPQNNYNSYKNDITQYLQWNSIQNAFSIDTNLTREQNYVLGIITPLGGMINTGSFFSERGYINAPVRRKICLHRQYLKVYHSKLPL
jgi:hypothetical protein